MTDRHTELRETSSLYTCYKPLLMAKYCARVSHTYLLHIMDGSHSRSNKPLLMAKYCARVAHVPATYHERQSLTHGQTNPCSWLSTAHGYHTRTCYISWTSVTHSRSNKPLLMAKYCARVAHTYLLHIMDVLDSKLWLVVSHLLGC